MGRVVLSILNLGALFIVLTAAQGSKTSTGTQTDPASFFSKMMDTTDWLRSGALVVAFLATNFAGRDTWLLADFISTLAFGVAFYFFPDAVIGYQTEGKLDPVHLYLAQGFGAVLIGIAVTSYASRDSADRSVSGAIFMSRILAGTVLLQAMIIDHMKAKKDKQRWSDSHMTFGMLGCGLWVLGNLWQYLRGPSYGSGGVDLKERLTKHLLVDLFVLFGLGVGGFAYPDFSLSVITMKGFTPDGIHAHLSRAMSALVLMTCLHGHSAMGFSDDIDKRAHLLGRFVSYAFFIPMMLLYQYKYAFVPMNHFYCLLPLVLIPFLNSGCAYFIRRKAKRN